MAKKNRKNKMMAHEKKRVRQTGALVKKLRAEQKAAETIEALHKAKQHYAERGDVNSCRDWLAIALKDAFRTEDGSFDLTALRQLKDNGVTPPNVDMERHGGEAWAEGESDRGGELNPLLLTLHLDLSARGLGRCC